MSSQKKKVQEAIDQLRSDAWARREIPGELERVAEIQALAEEQLREDTTSTKAHRDRRIRQSWVFVSDPSLTDQLQGYEPLYEMRPPEDHALEAAFDPITSQLTGEQRVLVRMVYGGRLTLRAAAEALGVTHPAVIKRLRVVHRELRRMLLAMFVPNHQEFPETQAEPSDPWDWPWDSELPEIEEPEWLDEPRENYDREPPDHLLFRGAPQPVAPVEYSEADGWEYSDGYAVRESDGLRMEVR